MTTTRTASDNEEHWLRKLKALNPATGRGNCRGKAPHKPLLLLSILDMAEQGDFSQRTFMRTPGLVLRFKTYGSLVVARWPVRLDVAMPFYYLKSQGFWRAFTKDMMPAASPESCMLCEMDEELFGLLGNPDFRLKARLLLVSRYFTKDEQVALLASLGLSDRKEAAASYVRNMSTGVPREARERGRCARFAVQVVSSYQFTCALTGLSCMTRENAAIVDAAHIEPWAKSRNDELTNGLALCKNAHWAFDEGLWSADRDYRIIVAQDRFVEKGPDALLLRQYAGRFLQFPKDARLRPDPERFAAHRAHHGL